MIKTYNLWNYPKDFSLVHFFKDILCQVIGKDIIHKCDDTQMVINTP